MEGGGGYGEYLSYGMKKPGKGHSAEYTWGSVPFPLSTLGCWVSAGGRRGAHMTATATGPAQSSLYQEPDMGLHADKSLNSGGGGGHALPLAAPEIILGLPLAS